MIRAVLSPRAGWDEAFQEMAAQGDDVMLDEGTTPPWEDTEWEW